MTMISHTFLPPQTPNDIRFVPYKGPPKSKQTSRHNPSKKVPSNEDEYPNLDEIRGIGPTSTSHGVEVIDPTCNSNIGGNRGGGSGDIGCDNSLSPQDGHQSGGFEQLVSMRTSREAPSDESLGQPAPSEGSSQENAVVIEDSQPDSKTNTDDKGCPLEDDIGAQRHDRHGIQGISTSDRRGRECSTGMEDAINSEVVRKPEPRASGLPRRKSTSTPSTPPIGSSTMNIKQSMRGTGVHALSKAIAYQPQRAMHKMAKGRGKSPLRVNISSSSSSSSSGSGSSNGFDNDTDDDDSVDHTTRLKRKRKRSQTSNAASKQRRKHAVHSARQRKPSSRDGPLPNRPSGPKPLSAARYSGYDTKICYSDDSRDDSSEEISDRGRHLGSNKQPKLTLRSGRSRNRDSADEDDEYEVERILKARVYRGKLQYRAKWLRYKDDPKWYDASNFKNSPYKLRDFHKANPNRPGPPKRLGRWVQCWEEERDAGDHADDNKPKRSYTGGGTP